MLFLRTSKIAKVYYRDEKALQWADNEICAHKVEILAISRQKAVEGGCCGPECRPVLVITKSWPHFSEMRLFSATMWSVDFGMV